MESKGIMCSCVLFFWFFLLLCLCSAVSTANNDACNKCLCRPKGSVSCESLDTFPVMSSFPPNTTTLRVLFSKGISVPTDILQHLKNLKYLYLKHNNIKKIEKFKVADGASSLITLSYAHNVIESIESGSFDELQQLDRLDLSHNRLKEFPIFNRTLRLSKLYLRENPEITRFSRLSLAHLPSLDSLYMERTGIQSIPAKIFRQNLKLTRLYFNKTKTLTTIDEDAFQENLPLKTLILDETSITSLPTHGLENLRELSLKNVPNLWKLPPNLESIGEVYLSDYNGFLCCAYEMEYRFGKDCSLPKHDEVVGQTTATVLHPSTTLLTSSSGGGFGPPPSTKTPPTSSGGGFPGGGGFGPPPSTKTPTTSSGGGFPGGGGFGPPPSTKTPTTSSGGGFGTQPSHKTHFTNAAFTFPTLPNVLNNTATPPPVITHSNVTPTGRLYQCTKIKVKCIPKSDAFHPCEDIMGHILLTIVSGLVGTVALVANLVVAVVLLTSKRHLNVTRFLMCNLAFADFCLGLYIFALTCASIVTHGNYYDYARQWQSGAGCKILGFLAVFSSELSLFTLVMMTIERFYAIVHAMHMNARLSFRNTVRAMIGGWIFALLMAAIPLLGVSGFDKVAICLPFDVSNDGSTAYVTLLLLINGASFVCVVYLYYRMLLVVIRGGDMDGAPKRDDSKVAKRMAILVFTDMLCWAPIAFFGLLAAFGLTLLNVTQSKILLVFFFPINSICNPFLYAFFTKAFKRELFMALSHIGFCKFRALKYNGTLSSFLYSRSRRNQSTANDNSTPKSKHCSITSFRQSNMELYRKDSKPDKVENLNGICNAGFDKAGQNENQTSPGSVRYVASATGSDQVFFSFATTPKGTDSPKSIIKKNSTTEIPQRAFFPKDDMELVERDKPEKDGNTAHSTELQKKRAKKVSIVDSTIKGVLAANTI